MLVSLLGVSVGYADIALLCCSCELTLCTVVPIDQFATGGHTYCSSPVAYVNSSWPLLYVNNAVPDLDSERKERPG